MTGTTITRQTAHASRVAWVKARDINAHTITIMTATTPYGTFTTASADNVLLAAAIISSKRDVAAFTRTQREQNPHARIVARHDTVWATAVFTPSTPLAVRAPDTLFRQTVHTALTTIAHGQIVSYRDVADLIGQPRATRAVAAAIAANTVAVAIPCHRVWRSNGTLGGFRWGPDVKQQLCQDEQTACL